MIKIPLVSTFNAKGFKQADRATTLLAGKFKGLALSLGAALSVRRITQFSKAAVKAFAEDNRAASALAQTMNNLGMAFQSPAVEEFIRRLSQSAAVADDVLRPALGDLLRATRNLGKAQEILNLGLDISAATGKDLRTVTTALSRAYLGNNASLGRLNAGLSKAFIASASFEQIQGKLEEMFAGSAQKAAGTYAGQLDKLRIASEEAKEMIGQSLVQSIELLGNQNGIDVATKKMEGFGRITSDVVLGFSKLVKDITGGADGKQGFFGNFVELVGDLTLINRSLADLRTLRAQAQQELLEPAQRQSIRAIENESAAAQARWLKEQRALDKIRKEQERIAKAAKASRLEAEKRKKILESLSKAGDILDTEKASIEAALQNEKLSENEILRLQLKKAILNENADRALQLADKLAESQREVASLKDSLTTFKPSNPFQQWDDTIASIRAQLAAINVGGLQLSTPQNRAPYESMMQLGQMTGNQNLVTAGAVGLAQLATNDISASDAALLEAELAAAEAAKSGEIAAQAQRAVNSVLNVYVQGTGGLDAQTKQEVVDAVVEASSLGYGTGWFRTTNRVAL